MAKFIVNSTQNKALLKLEVIAYEIQPYQVQHDEEEETGYQLLVTMSRGFDPDIIFEQAPTLEELTPLVTAFHNAMEEE